MCGIIGYTGSRDSVPIILNGLKRLEYRGYDSAGIAVLKNGEILVERCAGKLSALADKIGITGLSGNTGIGHTRWATHGRPTNENAHPHRSGDGKVIVAHNGIIENHLALKKRLTGAGHKFTTETDTEIIAHLVQRYYEGDFLKAVHRASTDLEGSYAAVLMHSDNPARIVAMKSGPPLVAGKVDDGAIIASDITALLDHTKDVYFLNDGEFAEITDEGANLYGPNLEDRSIEYERITWSPIMAERGGYKHFMLKEIHEQPQAVEDTLRGRLIESEGRVSLQNMDILDADFLSKMDRVVIVACGTSWHAGQIGKFLIERLADVPVEVDYGSEFRYRNPVLNPRTLVIGISQSGETADTIAALKEANSNMCRIVSICNVVGSAIPRMSDGVLYTYAGPEIGVASTKAFTAQLTALYILALFLGQERGSLKPDQTAEYIREVRKIPAAMQHILADESNIRAIGRRFSRHSDFLFLGRGINYPVALEGALKLKEISYIHAEGYPAGEMKHGPIALIDENMPVVVIVMRDLVFDKVRANIEEVKARDGIVIAIAPEEVADELNADFVITAPETIDLLAPLLNTVPLQLLAYHIAVRRGCDVDQPRNLAKCVTVE